MGLADIVSNILSFLLLITTVVSVYFAFKAYYHQKERTRKEAACNLARVYSDEILDKYAIVTTVMKGSGILEFIKETFPMDDIENFTLSEVLDFVAPQKMDTKLLQQKMTTFDHFSILNAIICKTDSVVERDAITEAYCKPANGCLGEPKNEQALQLYFADTISNLLNTLEWFSMNCRYGLADEKVLYQSLHQTFLSTVWMLYYYISVNNVSNVNKYYTNIIWLFTEWKGRLSEETTRYIKDISVAREELRNVKKQVANAGRVYGGKPL